MSTRSYISLWKYTSFCPHFFVQILFSKIIRILLLSFCKRSNIYPEIDFTAKLYDLRFEIWEWLITVRFGGCLRLHYFFKQVSNLGKFCTNKMWLPCNWGRFSNPSAIARINPPWNNPLQSRQANLVQNVLQPFWNAAQLFWQSDKFAVSFN